MCSPTRRPRAARRLAARAGGFTLIETALTTVIIGVGVLALIEAQQAFMRSNDWSTHAATATYLANEIREMTRTLPRHDPVTGLFFDASGASTQLVGWGPEPGEITVQDFDDLDDFDGITFAWNGTLGPADGDLPGPIDAFGAVIPEILSDGNVVIDQSGNPLPLQGWSQRVSVRKVNPLNLATAMANDAVLPPSLPDFQGLAVDQFPLRVTVEVFYQGPYASSPDLMATVVWVVPAN